MTTEGNDVEVDQILEAIVPMAPVLDMTAEHSDAWRAQTIEDWFVEGRRLDEGELAADWLLNGVLARMQARINQLVDDAVTAERDNGSLTYRIGVLENIERALTRQRDEANEKIVAMNRGMTYLANELADQCRKRGWCSEYNDIIRDINDHLPDCMHKLHMPTSTYEISFTIDATDEMAADLESTVDSALQNENFSSCVSYRFRMVNE